MIPAEIQHSLDLSIISSVPLSGGCVHHVHKLETSQGIFCIKYNRKEAFPGIFTGEAAGLKTLRESGEIRVPEVILTGESESYSFILLEYISSSKRIPDFMSDFGRCLAKLHRHTSTSFGFESDNYMGALPQSNTWHSKWTEFFRDERLVRQSELARKKGYLKQNDLNHFERLYQRLPELIPEEAPSLLHGDLWSGNYMVSEDGRACLIDPAVYYGSREADLAMTTLFGGFDPSFYDAYQEEFKFESGWKERLDIYNLYPLLIHLNLFGSGYLGSIQDILRKF